MDKVTTSSKPQFVYCKCMFKGETIKKCECSKDGTTTVPINKLKS